MREKSKGMRSKRGSANQLCFKISSLEFQDDVERYSVNEADDDDQESVKDGRDACEAEILSYIFPFESTHSLRDQRRWESALATVIDDRARAWKD